MTLARGLYDRLLTAEVRATLEQMGARSTQDEVASGARASYLVDLVSQSLARALGDIDGSASASVDRQVDLVMGILSDLRARVSSTAEIVETPITPITRLSSVGIDQADRPQLPAMGLNAPHLFTGVKSSPSLESELLRETIACDSIDILVSFITMSGVRRLRDVLRQATAPDAHGVGKTRIRVLTTTYTGATEQSALDELARLNGCSVRVSMDGRRTRLHAKAWIFQRASGFGTAYVGSANLSGAALLGGLEWTLKITQHSQSALYVRARANFEALWEDGEFVEYDPDSAESADKLRAALQNERFGSGSDARTTFFDVTPNHYQQEMLEQLQFERAHGRSRNLLVAATGTGKTVVAALDYRRSVAKHGSPPRLLFVAHRRELLEQARERFRVVLRDGSFGELLVGGESPATYDHLFASIDSITQQSLLERFGPTYWHTVVVDECHRLAATRFDELARTIKPAILLGLTATPERLDGQSLAPYFDMRPDGSPAAELRLWSALDLQLLAPFEYFACNDTTDFTSVPWGASGEHQALEALVTGNRARAERVLAEWRRLTTHPRDCRALIFCVSVAHAKYMTDFFNSAGTPVLLLHGGSTDEERRTAPARLASREICGIVTVDLYNEGVDLPQVDTLLFLRPTQSPVVFQQQLGRGLRLSEGKQSCLVLDFVGRHRAEFRFDRLLSSITGLPRTDILSGIENGFSKLPLGCSIHLERQARDQILSNLQQISRQSWRRLRSELVAYASLRGRNVRLADFVREQAIDIEEIYRSSRPSGWTSLKADAGLLDVPISEDHASDLTRSFRLLLHTDDPRQLAVCRSMAELGEAFEPQDPQDHLRAQMFAHQLYAKGLIPYKDVLQTLSREPQAASELRELVDVLESRARVSERSIEGFESLPLQLHARYSRREILTAVGLETADARGSHREGVATLGVLRTELLFVTIEKSKEFHPEIAYHDYALSTTRFHWQTQNSAGPATKSGRKYLESNTNGWRFLLFARETTAHQFVACGEASLASQQDISGNRPMSIIWTLREPLQTQHFRAFSELREI